jgi:uncharacterized membrane-anchored protein YhcB (DUF1043 family)
MRWRIGIGVITALVGLASGAAAQSADTMEALREKVQADKKLLVAATLDLTDAEAKAFWPVYGAYQSEMITHYDRVARLLDSYAKAYTAMSDEAAGKLLGDFVAIEVDHAALLKRYVARFEKVLPARKVARLYQLENKIRALLSYELAREIPLVK